MAPSTVTSLDQLEQLYDAPSERVRLKQIDHLDEHCRAFLLLATSGAAGADCSPRGDRPGFVIVEDDKTLLVPDRRGNNRIDSLRNIVENPSVGLLFLVPGIHETFRINGRARISVDPALLARFAVDDKPSKTVLIVTVLEAFIQCARALVRSDLWNPALHVRRADLPSLGTILAAHTGGKVDAASYDEEAAITLPRTLY
jgi:PPOX class probable FMN-dependent enzyme